MLKIDEVHKRFGENMSVWFEAMIYAENWDDFNLLQDLFIRLEGFYWLVLKANEYRIHADKEWKRRQLRKMR